jgi:hypothetical protein
MRGDAPSVTPGVWHVLENDGAKHESVGRPARTQAAGLVDLRFSDEIDWRIGLELKINSRFGHQQRRATPNGPNPGDRPEPRVVQRPRWPQGLRNWVGAPASKSPAPRATRSEITGRRHSRRRALPEVVEADADFEETKPRHVRLKVRPPFSRGSHAKLSVTS